MASLIFHDQLIHQKAILSAMSHFFESVPGVKDCTYLRSPSYVERMLLAYENLADLDRYSEDSQLPNSYKLESLFSSLEFSDLMESLDHAIEKFSEYMSCSNFTSADFPLSQSQFEQLSMGEWTLSHDGSGWLISVPQNADDLISRAWKHVLAEALSGNEPASVFLKFMAKNSRQYSSHVHDVNVSFDYFPEQNVFGQDTDDGEHSWVVRFSSNDVIKFENEDAACAYQRLYRSLVGLDPSTGEIVAR